MRAAWRAIVVAGVAALASAAHAKVPGTSADGVFRFPSADIPSVAALKNAVQNPDVTAIVFDPGDYDLGTGLFVAARDDLLLCGATGNAKDVVLESSSGSAVAVQEARRITFRGVTLATTASFGSALRLIAAPTSSLESYVDDVVVDRCTLKGYIGVQASVRVRNLTVTRSRITVTGSGPQNQGGVGVLWEDGPGLFVGRTRFATDDGVPAVSGVLVRGAQSGTSEGERAEHVLLVGNTVAGDFARGFDLADVVGARVRDNSVAFPNSVTSSALPGIDAGSGRVGVIVRRANASALTEDFELQRNRVRGAFYGAWLVNTGQGFVRANDFRGSGSTSVDAEFGDHGGGLRLNVQSESTQLAVFGNDLRGLRSPISDPAVVVFPPGTDPAGFFPADHAANRVDRGRPLYVVQTE